MAVGTGIDAMRRNLELRRLNNANLRKGTQVVQAATVGDSPSVVSDGGTDYPAFVPGVDDPEDSGFRIP